MLNILGQEDIQQDCSSPCIEKRPKRTDNLLHSGERRWVIGRKLTGDSVIPVDIHGPSVRLITAWKMITIRGKTEYNGRTYLRACMKGSVRTH